MHYFFFFLSLLRDEYVLSIETFERSRGGKGVMPMHQWILGKFETGFSWGSLPVEVFRAFKLFMFYVGGIMDICHVRMLTESKHVDEVINGT